MGVDDGLRTQLGAGHQAANETREATVCVALLDAVLTVQERVGASVSTRTSIQLGNTRLGIATGRPSALSGRSDSQRLVADTWNGPARFGGPASFRARGRLAAHGCTDALS